MLQPTSCGPGPPAMGWRQQQQLQQQHQQHYEEQDSRQEQQQHELPWQQQQPQETQNATNCCRNVADDCRREQINKQQQLQQEQQQQHEQQHHHEQQHLKDDGRMENEEENKENMENGDEKKVKCWQRQINVSKSNGKWSINNNNNYNNNDNIHYNNSNNDNIHYNNSNNNIIGTHCSKNNLSKFLTRRAVVVTKTATTTTTAAAVKWSLVLLTLFAFLAAAPTKVTAEKSKHYYMQSMCKSHFLQQLYRKIDGAVLWSQNERNLDCVITFQTHSILQRFMLRFDMLQLDCNDHLYVYDGAHAVGNPKIDISCRNTKQTVSSILTRTNFVTLKYVTDGWGTDANGFKLVITSVKDPQHTCKDFTCATREFCIHPDLLCDGINHCGDNSDESVHNLCQSETSSTILGLELTWFVLVVVSAVLVLSACVVGWSICFCRSGASGANGVPQTTAMQMHHAAESNGSSKHLHQYGVHGTLTREHTKLPASGNWRHPAGPSGYRRTTQRNLLKMATKVRPIWCLASFVN